MPRVENYEFGHITIDGEAYTNDLKVFPNGVKPDWWRSKGHLLQPDDIDDVIDHGPDKLVIGQGNSGRMQIAEETKKELQQEGIELLAEKTQDAVETYNEADADVIGAFHLTC